MGDFIFSDMCLVDYSWPVRPWFHEVVSATDRQDQARSLYFPCLQVTEAILEFHNVSPHSQVNLNDSSGASRGEAERGMEIQERPDGRDDSSVISFSSSRSICFYALESPLRSRSNLYSS